MTINQYPRLCGGTFFTLVLQALRQRMKAREHYAGDSDGLTNPEVLVGLIKVINPDYQDPGKRNLKSIANNYKECKTSNSTYLPFNDTTIISSFDSAVRNGYDTVLSRMITFVNDFIDLSEAVHKDIQLVRALVDLIQQDQSIEDDEEFFIGQNGEKKKKAAFGDLNEVCFPSFLLGVWHYIVVYRKDNSVGKGTYDAWCPSNNGAPRIFVATIGDGVFPDLKLSKTNTPSSQVDEGETFDEKPTIEIIDEPQQNGFQQTINNPFVFNFTQNGNNNTQIGHIEHYHAGKKED